ncbi:uncharacterized protein DS421_3g84770 [Arachis hypogaea]|nr:uncharacterized protein DS421_3g84770 [Arachis hypogaea]
MKKFHASHSFHKVEAKLIIRILLFAEVLSFSRIFLTYTHSGTSKLAVEMKWVPNLTQITTETEHSKKQWQGVFRAFEDNELRFVLSENGASPWLIRHCNLASIEKI